MPFDRAICSPVAHHYRQKSKKSIRFLLLCGNTGYSLVTACAPGSIDHSEKAKGRLHFVFRVVLHFKECFKRVKHFCNQSITKSSTKPWSGASTNHHLCGNGERNQEQSRTKVSFGRTMMQLELQQLAKGTPLDEVT